MELKKLKMKPVRIESIEQYHALLRYVFQFPTMQKADVIGWFDGDNLVSQVVVYPMNVQVYKTVYPMGGLTGVGTYPEYSGKGLMYKL